LWNLPLRLGWFRLYPVMQEIKWVRWVARGNEITYVCDVEIDITCETGRMEISVD